MNWYKKAMAQVFYHGTSSDKSAEEILRNGIRPPELGNEKTFLTPVRGRVYMSPSLRYAIIYCLGGDMLGHEPPEIKLKDPYGYLFEIQNVDMSNLQPDEDSVGEAIYEEKFWWLNDLAKRIVAPSRLQRLMDGEYIYYASVGKQLMPYLTPSQKNEIMESGAHVAHQGAVKPSRAWRFDKRKSKLLHTDGSNFFELAEQIL